MTDRLRSPTAWAGVTLKTAAIAGAALLLSGCAAWPNAGNNGLFYTQTTRPFAILDPEAKASRTGKACSTGVLGLIATGNTSIDVAMANAGITRISTVEESFTHFLFGIYSSYCTIVKGT